MATKTKIEWTEMTWNPVTGCTKISQGCKHCYAERLAKRLQAMGVQRYRNGFEVTLHPETLNVPLTWKTPRYVFVNSMSDLFHQSIPTEYILRVFDVMNKARQHTFQVLTKRSERLVDLANYLPWTPNIWIGVSVENQETTKRIADLKAVPAAIRFLSIEPLLGPIENLSLEGIHWVIVGGESGPNSRPMNPEWVQGILRKCEAKSVPFFFKQWGGRSKFKTGRMLNGRHYDEMPVEKLAMAETV